MFVVDASNWSICLRGYMSIEEEKRSIALETKSCLNMDAAACSELDEGAVLREMGILSAQTPGGPLMSEAEVAKLLKLKPKTMQNKRHSKPGQVPPHVRFPGRKGVLYCRDAVMRFIAQTTLLARSRRIHRL